jgi:23S rRNA (pseudouridine1915-N3)-methyltransferase
VKLWLISVGRPGGLLQPAIAEYETRARRYWPLDVVEVREERARKGMPDADVRDAEAERILKRVPNAAELVALTRNGTAWGSARLARHLETHALHGGGGDVAFVIGGALGLGTSVVTQARLRLRLSDFTMPHDLARLVLLEQLYRAGTIVRGEPYHKGDDES